MTSFDIIVSLLGDSKKKEWMRSEILDIVSDELKIDKKEASSRFNDAIKRTDFFGKISDDPAKYCFSKSGKFRYNAIHKSKISNTRFELELTEFLRKYYWSKLLECLKNGDETIEIEGDILRKGLPEFYDLLFLSPSESLERINTVLQTILNDFDSDIYNKTPPKVSIIKINDVLQVEDIRTKHIGKFVEVEGRVIFQNMPNSELIVGAFQCIVCDHVTIVQQETGKYTEPYECEFCQRKGHFKLLPRPESEYKDAQSILIESLKGEIAIKVHLMESLCRSPWERNAKVVRICGVVTTQAIVSKSGSKSNCFNWMIEANSVIIADDSNVEPPTEKEIEQFETWAKNPVELRKNILETVAPNIYGMLEIKDACSLTLFSDWNWNEDPDDIVERSSIHVLNFGDPGVAKSQIIKDVVYLAPKGKFGQVTNMSKGGLSTSAVMEQGEWCIKSGFFSQVDQGIAGLDEMDKVNDPQDMNCLVSVLNDQNQKVSKVGKIDITFNTRVALLGAANPKKGYLKKENIIDQIAETIPAYIFQRFDFIFVIRDVPDKERDKIVIRTINQMHSNPKTSRKNVARKIDPVLFKKYVLYARSKPVPEFEPNAQKTIEEYYLKIREVSRDYPIIGARQGNDLNRIARAIARRELAIKVTEEHVKYAIGLKKASLLTLTDEQDYGVFNFGRTKSQVECVRSIRTAILDLCKSNPCAKIEDIAFNINLDTVQVEHSLILMENNKEVYAFKGGYRIR